MPPKKQIAESMILDKAYELTRQYGFESFTARSLAKSLGCSTQPIYQAFSDMQGLKARVTALAISAMFKHIRDHMDAALPRDLAALLGYIHFALQEKRLFQLIATSGTGLSDIPRGSGYLADLQIDMKMIVFANGIVMMSAFQALDASWENIKALTLEAYAAFVQIK